MKLIALTAVLSLVVCGVAGGRASSGCTLKWKNYPNTRVFGLIQQPLITIEGDCKPACVDKDDCWNIDFDLNTNSCWFGTTHEPASRVDASGINHYDLIEDCTPVTTTTTVPPPPPTPAPTGVDCLAIRKAYPTAPSGVYYITVPGKINPVQVYCDMDTSYGGWTVFQRRRDGSENFERGWADYAIGFGNVNDEFWLGNDILTALTSSRRYRLRIDLGSFDGRFTYAEYNDFKVSGAADKYKLSFSNCSYVGNAGNALGGDRFGSTRQHNGMKFSTIDQDNDNNGGGSCAKNWHGGWWYNVCHSANLNGKYNNTISNEGVIWNESPTLKSSEMKIISSD